MLRVLDAATGAVRWSVDLGAEITGAASYVPPSAGVGPTVIVGGYDGRVHRVDLTTGADRWVYATGSYLYGSAALTGDLAVIGGCDGFVHSVRVSDGGVVSKVAVEAYVGASVGVDGGKGYVGHFGNKVVSFDPAKGTAGWTYFDRGFPYLSSPAIGADVIVLGGRDKAVHGVDRVTGQAAWWGNTMGQVDSSPVIVGSHVVVGSADGRLYVMSVEDGAVERSLDVGGAITASPAVASGWVFIGAADGTFHAFGPRIPGGPK
jgi:outer membrane protein assembly factor BamB